MGVRLFPTTITHCFTVYGKRRVLARRGGAGWVEAGRAGLQWLQCSMRSVQGRPAVRRGTHTGRRPVPTDKQGAGGGTAAHFPPRNDSIAGLTGARRHPAAVHGVPEGVPYRVPDYMSPGRCSVPCGWSPSPPSLSGWDVKANGDRSQ